MLNEDAGKCAFSGRGKGKKAWRKEGKEKFLAGCFFSKGLRSFSFCGVAFSLLSQYDSFELHASFRADYFVFVLYFVFAILLPLKERAGNADGASLKAGCQSAGGVFSQHASYFGCHVLRCD